jgi:hypothetical protein
MTPASLLARFVVHLAHPHIDFDDVTAALDQLDAEAERRVVAARYRKRGRSYFQDLPCEIVERIFEWRWRDIPQYRWRPFGYDDDLSPPFGNRIGIKRPRCMTQSASAFLSDARICRTFAAVARSAYWEVSASRTAPCTTDPVTDL